MKPLEIKACRVRLGIKVSHMADALGITDDAYRKKEKGEVSFKPTDIPIVAKELSMTAQQVNDYFFDGELPDG